MMSKDPASRFQTPSALADALAPFVEQHGRNRPAITDKHKPQLLQRAAVWPRVLVAAMLLITATALGAVLFVMTDQGTVIITSPDANSEVVISQDGTGIIETIRGSKEVRLPSGEYRIALKGNDDQFTLKKKNFTVARGSEETVAVLRQAHPSTPSTAIKAINDMNSVLIPAGKFTMGTPVQRKATPDERRHEVTITTPFHIGMLEVTQQQYTWVMGKNPSGFCASGDQKAAVADEDTSRYPVESVSCEDAIEFCRRLTALPEAKRAAHVYRLPTEAEWELACRAGTATTFHFGDGLNGRQANVNGKQPWGISEPGPSLARTTETGSYRPNAFGLFDMHGNVWEWCSDWYTLEYYSNSPLTDPTGPASGSSRVVRGGAWNWGALYARSTAREQRDPGYRDDSLGFRVVRTSKNPDANSPRAQTPPP